MARRRGKRFVAEGYNKAAKKKRYLGTFDTRSEAKDVESKWRLRTHGTSKETCDQFAERWVRDYPRPRASTNVHNNYSVQQFAKDFKGVKLNEVDRPAARSWARNHASCLPSVRAMYGDAQRDGLVEVNPFAGLRLPGSKGRKEIVALTEVQLHALGDVAFDSRMELGDYAPQYRAMILFAGYTGVRPGELFALERKNIKGDEAYIERALSSLTREIGPTKNGKSRWVPIPPKALEALRDVPPHQNGLLFVSPAGKMWTKSSHNRYWERLRLIANRPGLSFYELRHCAASMLMDRGVSPRVIAEQLGHEDGGWLVANLYGHPDKKLMRQQLHAAWSEEVKPLEVARDRRSA